MTNQIALGPDFCQNIALAPLGFATTFRDLFTKVAAGAPDAGWDFDPDKLNMKEETILLMIDQGGEPHTFTKVKNFGGGFVPDLNAGGREVSELCAGGFRNVDVAKTRILQDGSVAMTDLSTGEHRFRRCIHPWMRMTVEVRKNKY